MVGLVAPRPPRREESEMIEPRNARNGTESAKMVRLGEVFDLHMGKTPPRANPSYWGGSHKWISIADIGKADVYISETKESISDEAISATGISLIPQNTLIMSFKLSIGKVAITSEEMFSNEAIMAFRDLGKYELDLHYLYHQFKNKDWSEGINKAVMGLTLNKASLKCHKILLPSLSEQKRIAGVLDKISEMKRNVEARLKKLDLLVKARFNEMFGDVGERRFLCVRLGEIMEIKHGYAFEGEGFSDIDNGVVVVTPGNFMIGGGFKSDKNRFFTKDYPAEYVLKSGSLIITMTDLSKRSDTLGYAAIVPSDKNVYLHNQRIGLAHSFRNDVNIKYVEYAMRTQEYRQNIIATQVGSTVHHTSPTKILDSPIPLPPLALQQEFAGFVEKVEGLKAAAKKELEKVDLLYRAKLQEFFG